MKDLILSEFREAANTLDRVINSEQLISGIQQAAEKMITCLDAGNKIISCGNGGSMSDAMHFAEELTGRFREDRPPIPALSISDPSYISCVGNDYGFDHVFSRFVQGIGNKGDVLLAISTSGNSQNVINAAKSSKDKEMEVISLLGNDGGDLVSHSDISLIVPHQGYSDRIQEIHIKIIHILILTIEKNINN